MYNYCGPFFKIQHKNEKKKLMVVDMFTDMH